MFRKVLVFIFSLGLAFSSPQDLINAYCDGKTPCYLCTDGSEIKECINEQLCPIGIVSCSITYETLFEIDKPYEPCNCCFGCLCNNPPGFVFNGGKPLSAGVYYTSVVKTFTSPITTKYSINFSAKSYVYSAACSLSSAFPYYAFAVEAFINGAWRIVGVWGNTSAIKGYISTYLDYMVKQGTSMRIVLYSYSPSGSKYVAVIGTLKVLKGVPMCPYGNPCVLQEKKYVCSKYKCYNPLTTPTQITDTPEGINDKQDDGQITDQGCLGNIYIFNGHDYRCRPPGIQTGFSDCCKKTTTWFGLGQCSETEKYLSQLRSWGELDGKCHYIGEYCSEKWLGVCVQKKKTFCCYSSPLARIIVEAAHQQLGIPWGSPEAPNCRGLTPEEFQKLDFSKIDFSEWINYEIETNIVPTVNTSLSNALNNLKTTVQSTNY